MRPSTPVPPSSSGDEKPFKKYGYRIATFPTTKEIQKMAADERDLDETTVSSSSVMNDGLYDSYSWMFCGCCFFGNIMPGKSKGLGVRKSPQRAVVVVLVTCLALVSTVMTVFWIGVSLEKRHVLKTVTLEQAGVYDTTEVCARDFFGESPHNITSVDTFDTLEEAQDERRLVLHCGSCGACSSNYQDLKTLADAQDQLQYALRQCVIAWEFFSSSRTSAARRCVNSQVKAAEAASSPRTVIRLDSSVRGESQSPRHRQNNVDDKNDYGELQPWEREFNTGSTRDRTQRYQEQQQQQQQQHHNANVFREKPFPLHFGSDTCQDCWTDHVACARRKCRFTCTESFLQQVTRSGMDQCMECIEKMCQPSFLACSGVDHKRLGILTGHDVRRNHTFGQCESLSIDWHDA